MLVLSRKEGETIIIGEGDNAIVLTVFAINGNRTSIGIKAPKEIKIVRSELLTKENDNEAA